MKIDEISDGFCTKIREAGGEDAASERILVQNTPKDIDCHRVLIQNSRFLGVRWLFGDLNLIIELNFDLVKLKLILKSRVIANTSKNTMDLI
jgi:hypothetical protein